MSPFVLFYGGKLLYKEFAGKTIREKIEEDTNFTYVTTITVEEPNKHKEFVYRSVLNMDETCKRIIKMDPENIDYVTIDTNSIKKKNVKGEAHSVKKESFRNSAGKTSNKTSLELDAGEDDISQRFIRSKDVAIIIYKSEDSLTYVQINEELQKETTSSSSGNSHYYGHYYRHLYRPYRYYDSTSDFYSNSIYRSSNVNTEQYSNYLSSARQESVRTRSSSGGGTRFGK